MNMRRTRRTDGVDDLLTLKKKICEAIDENRDAFIALGHSVLREPETAFSEFKTAEKVRAALSGLGLQCQSGQAITGITADLHGRSDAAMIALMGELDAIILPDYPFADKTTGAAHVRGWDTGYIKECNEIVNRCLRVSALAAGAAKMLACTAAELLYNGAEKARLVRSHFKPVMTKKEYLEDWCGITD